MNEFAGWKPGSNRAKVYVYLNNDAVNQTSRVACGLDTDASEDAVESVNFPFCNTTSQHGHSECRNCGHPMNLEQQIGQEEDLTVLKRLKEL